MATKKNSKAAVTRATRRPKRTADDAIRELLETIQPEFVEQGARKIGPRDLEYVVAKAEAIRTRFRTGQALRRYARDADRMLEIVTEFHAGRYREPSFWSVAVMAFGLAYALRSIDVIPDTLPVVGEFDDAIVISICLALTKSDVFNYKAWVLIATPRTRAKAKPKR